MLLCKSLDFARHNVHFQASVKVTVFNVSGCTDNVPKYFVLESLYDVYITLFGSGLIWLRKETSSWLF